MARLITIDIDEYVVDMEGRSFARGGEVGGKHQCCVHNNDTNHKLVVEMLSGERVEVAYGEEERQMAFWEYLTKRLYPACQRWLHWDAEKVSVRGVRFLYNTRESPCVIDLSSGEAVVVVEAKKKKQFVFDYENRLLKMGEVIVRDPMLCCMGYLMLVVVL